jgi:transcriptional regulator with GAF, ATPase, and Fis domain
VVERALAERSLVLVGRAGEDSPEPSSSLLLYPQGASVLCLPLLHEGRAFGALYLDLGSPATLEDLDPGVMEVLSTVLGLLVSRERLARELEARSRDQETRAALAEETLKSRESAPPVGSSETFRQALETADRVAPTDVSVLLLGETGVGKEVFARRIHEGSSRRAGHFVVVNSAAIPETLVEAELFGTERGAATSIEPRPGRFELAHQGTLFLDEIGDLALTSQAKILRALQEREVVRVGGTRPRPADVRVIAATNRDLAAMVRDGTFREDLLYRLRVVEIRVPALRERREDIYPLARHFVEQCARDQHKGVVDLSPGALRALELYAWPGNVRELRNAIERAVVLARGEVIEPEDLPLDVLQEGDSAPGESDGGLHHARPWIEAKKAFEEEYFRRRLEGFRGTLQDLARAMGVSRRLLHMKMREHGLERSAGGERDGES